MKKTLKRNSAVELLRIISMILIIAQHYVYHGGYERSVFLNTTANIVYLKILSVFGYSACTVFALITGYYLIKADTKKGFYQRLIPLIAQTLFYSVAIALIVYLTKLVPVSTKELIKQFLSPFYGNWYVVFYILTFLFVPFINPFLISLSKEDYRKMLMIMMIVFIGIQSVLGDVYALSNFDFMLISYFTGAYVRLYEEDFRYDNRINLLITVVLFAGIAASIPVMDLLGKIIGSTKFVENDTFMVRWNIIPSFALSLFAFLYAVRKDFSCSFINVISSAVLGIYLIHDGLLKSLIWEKISPNVDFVDNPYLHSIIKILAVFAVCSLIDLIRQKLLETPFLKLIDKRK